MYVLLVSKHRSTQAGIAIISLLSLFALPFLLNVQAQNTTPLLTTDEFNIPQLGSSINFAVNGSYRSATLENNTWIFRGLALNNTQTQGTLQISTENTNITITDFRSNPAFGRSQYVRYISDREGIQRINLGNNYTTNIEEWMVTHNRQYLNAGKDWQLQRNNTVIVNSQPGNMTVIHYNWDMPYISDLPFLEQHSIALTVAAIFAGTVLVATTIRIKRGDKRCLQ